LIPKDMAKPAFDTSINGVSFSKSHRKYGKN